MSTVREFNIGDRVKVNIKLGYDYGGREGIIVDYATHPDYDIVVMIDNNDPMRSCFKFSEVRRIRKRSN